MPVLIVYGMPNTKIDEEALNQLAYGLSSVVGINLEMDPEEVSVFFPVDLLQRGLGEELVCFVEGVFRFEEPSERHRVLRKELADRVMHALRGFAEIHLSQVGALRSW